MQPFEYANPKTVKEAVGLLGPSWGEVDVLAGGTDLISLMKDYIATPKRVVNIKGIKELGGIQKGTHGWRIGATVTFDELASNQALHAELPSLVTAAMGVSSPQIRNMGTVGGDLCQRPRCWYYRNGCGLLGMKDGKSLIPNGENEYHAIFGGGPAYFVSPSSLGPALIALNAKVKLVSGSGSREVDAAKFFLAPKNENEREVELKPNEILTEVHIPVVAGLQNATYEVRQKDALDWPLATASVAVMMRGTVVDRASIVLGHVAPTPWPATQAGNALAGKSLSDDVIEQTAAAAVAGAAPLSKNGYKVQLAKVAVKRALLAASAKA